MDRKLQPCDTNMNLRYETELTDDDFKRWLKEVVFSDDGYFSGGAFASSESLYHFDLNRSRMARNILVIETPHRRTRGGE